MQQENKLKFLNMFFFLLIVPSLLFSYLRPDMTKKPIHINSNIKKSEVYLIQNRKTNFLGITPLKVSLKIGNKLIKVSKKGYLTSYFWINTQFQRRLKINLVKGKPSRGPLNFQGYYYGPTQNIYHSYLKFYRDGTVISLISSGQAHYIQKMLNQKNPRVSIGKYRLRKNKIYFVIKTKFGKLMHRGIFRNRFLECRGKNIKTKAQWTQKYYFVENMPTKKVP